MCALVHTSCFESIKPIYVQYKKSTQKKIFATQFLEAAVQRKKTTPNTEQSQKFLIDQFQDAIQKKKRNV